MRVFQGLKNHFPEPERSLRQVSTEAPGEVARLRPILWIAIPILLLLGIATLRRNAVWNGGPIAVWADASGKAPQLLRPHLNLGTAYADAGQNAKAIDQFRMVMDLAGESKDYMRPRDMKLAAETNIGGLLIREAQAEHDPGKAWLQYREAAHVLTQAWIDFPGSPFVAVNLAILANVAGVPDRALAIAVEAIGRIPVNGPPDAIGALYWNGALALQALHRCQEAAIFLTKARGTDPDLTGWPIPACS